MNSSHTLQSESIVHSTYKQNALAYSRVFDQDDVPGSEVEDVAKDGAVEVEGKPEENKCSFNFKEVHIRQTFYLCFLFKDIF